jgi:hypothetical protein
MGTESEPLDALEVDLDLGFGLLRVVEGHKDSSFDFELLDLPIHVDLAADFLLDFNLDVLSQWVGLNLVLLLHLNYLRRPGSWLSQEVVFLHNSCLVGGLLRLTQLHRFPRNFPLGHSCCSGLVHHADRGS